MHALLQSETRISFTNLAQQEGIGVASVWRWAMKGIGGVRMESFRLGGRRYTTEEAFRRFIALTSGDSGAVRYVTPKQRQSAIAQAEQDLERMFGSGKGRRRRPR